MLTEHYYGSETCISSINCPNNSHEVDVIIMPPIWQLGELRLREADDSPEIPQEVAMPRSLIQSTCFKMVIGLQWLLLKCWALWVFCKCYSFPSLLHATHLFSWLPTSWVGWIMITEAGLVEGELVYLLEVRIKHLDNQEGWSEGLNLIR